MQGQHLARIAADIMFSDKYLNLLESIYSQPDSIVEFEQHPKSFLLRHGIDLPDGIDVVLHDPGALNRPARVDFHFSESTQPGISDKTAARANLRELARLAWETLHIPAMRELRRTIQSSPVALRDFAANPREYAAANGVVISDDFDIIVHPEKAHDVRIDLHFEALRGGVHPLFGGGCCYCGGGGCCYYYRE